MDDKRENIWKKSRGGWRGILFASLLMGAAAFAFAFLADTIAFYCAPDLLFAYMDGLPLFVRRSQELTFLFITFEVTAVFYLAAAMAFGFYCFAGRLFSRRDSKSGASVPPDLERMIACWRQEMFIAGIKKSATLDELEIHLREEMERQMKSGLNGQKAFEISVQQIGQPKVLKQEFKKSERSIAKQIAIIALGIFGVLFGPGLILPALAQHNQMGIWDYEMICPVVLGAIITLAGISATIFGFKKRKA